MHSEPASLAGRTYVVAGGAGIAGEAVVTGLVRHGAAVVASSRSAERANTLQRRVRSDRLSTVVRRLETVEDFARLGDEIKTQHGPIHGAVAALGGWWEGLSLTELDLDEWNRILSANLTSHFVAARTFLPPLIGVPDAVYVMLAGVGAACPLPNSGPVSVTGAAQTRLLEVLDAQGTGVRLHEVRIMSPIITDRPERNYDMTDGLNPATIGDFVAGVVSPNFAEPSRRVLELEPPRVR